MSDISNEPTMEDILSSIKKIISEDSAKVLSTPRARRSAAREEVNPIRPQADLQPNADAAEDDILEPVSYTHLRSSLPQLLLGVKRSVMRCG